MVPLRAALAGGGTRARMAGFGLVARDNFPFGVVFWPVGEGRRGPEAAFRSPSSAFGVGLHRRRPQVGVIDIALRPVEDELAGRSFNAGCRLNEGILTQRNQKDQKSDSATKKTEQQEMRLTAGGGLAREYGSLPNCQSSPSSQFAMWFTMFATSARGISLVHIRLGSRWSLI